MFGLPLVQLSTVVLLEGPMGRFRSRASLLAHSLLTDLPYGLTRSIIRIVSF